MDARRDESGRPPDQGSRAPARSSIAAPVSDRIHYLCIDGRHQEVGRMQPDGTGHLTVNDGAWAYCAAGLYTEPHVWTEITERRFSDISHSDPADRP
jgi:hypothetical protein